MKAKKTLSVTLAAAMAAGLLVGCGRRGRFYRGLRLHCCFYRG